VIRAATEHAGAPPHEVLVLVAAIVPLAVVLREGAHAIRLVGDFPAAIGGGVIEPERLIGSADAAQRGLPGELEHRGFLDRVIIPTRFEEKDFRASQGEDVSGHASCGARPDDNNVIVRLGLATGDQWHLWYIAGNE
jgi:hypothetical protein